MDEKPEIWPPEPTRQTPVKEKPEPVNCGSKLVLLPAAFAGFFLFLLTWAIIFFCMTKVDEAHSFSRLPRAIEVFIGALGWIVVPNLIPGMLYFRLRQRFVLWAYGFLVGSGVACVLFAFYAFNAG